MSVLSPSPGQKKSGRYGSAGLFMSVPTLMAAAIFVGFFGGRWADSFFGTKPYLALVGLVLGLGAAGREIYALVKKAESMQEKEGKE